MAKNNTVWKWAAGILASVFIAGVLLAAGTVKNHDVRLREVEQSSAAITERLEGMQRSLDRIERKLE